MPNETWDFSMTVERGGLNNIHLAYSLDHIFMNERTLLPRTQLRLIDNKFILKFTKSIHY